MSGRRDLPWGATWDGWGTDFKIFASHAERVTLCLFDDPNSATENRRLDLERTESPGGWHKRMDGVIPGTLYGYRVEGPWQPDQGHFHHPSKLLIDPWAKAVTGEPRGDLSLFPFLPDGESRNELDSAAAMPKSVVVDDRFDFAPIEHPEVPWRDTVIYEVHVGGMTRLHREIPPELRGTYLGLCSPPMLEHFGKLGVTTLELLPVHQAAPEAHLLAQGRRNYWGYAPVSFFAPAAAYATASRGEQVGEFRHMVQTLHAAGLEVILDVVFNHSAEGDTLGPVYGPKGLDGATFFRQAEGRFVNFTGTGNTLDIRQPIVVDLVLDSLRHWVSVLGVDGFRFDLAPVIGRDPEAFTAGARLFEEIAADPQLRSRKWIAEPWDLGPGGYQLGAFPAPWREWNDRFRDVVRRFWRGEASGGLCAELVTRWAGSQDLMPGRSPLANIHYVTAHDGFTLNDLVSYERKHNEANGEENRDGRDENLSRNWGTEGPTEDPEILARRRRARRGLMATLLLAQGVPMIGHGDEIGRTQDGNNNAYCQDNELSWVDWSKIDTEFLDFTRRVLALRRQYPQLRRENFLSADDVTWRGPDGEPLEAEHWQNGDLKAFSIHLQGPPGHPDLLLVINGDEKELQVTLPEGLWQRHLETAHDPTPDDRAVFKDHYPSPGHSIALFS